MKVENMLSSNGNKTADQFIITSEGKETFQSYDSVIAVKDFNSGEIILDQKYWDYSTTTGKYRNQFLGEGKKETEEKIKEGIYKLSNLN